MTWGLYLALHVILSHQIAYAIAYAAGILLQFALHSRFVFGVPMDWRSGLGYPGIHLFLYAFGAVLLQVLVVGAGVDTRLAPLIVVIASVPLSYGLTRRWLVPHVDSTR